LIKKTRACAEFDVINKTWKFTEEIKVTEFQEKDKELEKIEVKEINKEVIEKE